jgi:hypothetical protein
VTGAYDGKKTKTNHKRGKKNGINQLGERTVSDPTLPCKLQYEYFGK